MWCANKLVRRLRWFSPGVVLLGLLLAAVFTQASERAPSIPVEDMVAVELATVGLDRFSGTPVVVLREPQSGDVVLISIGDAEAMAILLAMREVATPRPMTHDLLASVIESLNARLSRVMVDALVNNTYLGVLELYTDAGAEPLFIDTRPSDALALAVRTGATILVAPDVLVSASRDDFEALPGDQVVTALGITVGRLSDDLREALEVPEQTSGVLVSRALGDAATQGLRPGALIVSVNGEAVTTPSEFLRQVRATPADTQVQIRYWLGDQSYDIELSTDVPDLQPGIPRPGSGVRI